MPIIRIAIPDLPDVPSLSATGTISVVPDGQDLSQITLADLNASIKALDAYTRKTSSFVASQGGRYGIVTNGDTFNMTLPTAPDDGAIVEVVDLAHNLFNAAANAVAGSGDTIEGGSSLNLAICGHWLFVYSASTHEWQSFASMRLSDMDLRYFNPASPVALPHLPLTGSGAGPNQSLFSNGTNLYWKDGAGNIVQLA